MAAAVLLIRIVVRQRRRFLRPVAVAACACIGGISAGSTGCGGHGRGADMRMSFFCDHRNAFCFGVAAGTGIGQLTGFCGGGLSGDGSCEDMLSAVDLCRTAFAAPVPVMGIVVAHRTQSGDTMTANGTIVGFPRCTFHTDAVAASKAFRHYRTAALA